MTCKRFVNIERHKNVSFSDICFWIFFLILSFSRIRLSAISSSFRELCLRSNCARISLCCAICLYGEFSSNGNSGSSDIDCFCLINFGRLDVDDDDDNDVDDDGGGIFDVFVCDDVVNTEFVTELCVNGSSTCDCFISAPRLGTLERDLTICFGGGLRMLPRLRLFNPTDDNGSGISSKSSSLRNSIGRSLASS
jgi:hypothetical protein